MLYPNIEYLCLRTIVFYMHWEMTLILCKLQSDVDAFINWCTENGLKINSGKTKAYIPLRRKILASGVGIRQ